MPRLNASPAETERTELSRPIFCMSAGMNGTGLFLTSLEVEQAESRKQTNKPLINAGFKGASDRCLIFSIVRIAVEKILAMVAGRADLVKFHRRSCGRDSASNARLCAKPAGLGYLCHTKPSKKFHKFRQPRRSSRRRSSRFGWERKSGAIRR